MLEEKIAAAHSGWSEIPFCLIQDGFHCEISEDQYRIKMEKPEGRREKRERCSVWSGQLGSRCLDFCCCCYTEINSIQSECCFCVTDLSRVLYCIRRCTMWVAFIEFKMIGYNEPRHVAHILNVMTVYNESEMQFFFFWPPQNLPPTNRLIHIYIAASISTHMHCTVTPSLPLFIDSTCWLPISQPCM